MVKELLKEMVTKDASDMHLKVESVPILRISKELISQDSYPKITSKAMSEIISEIANEEQRVLYLAILGERRSAKATPVWLADAAGRIVRHKVRLGLTDSSCAEIVGDHLRAGDRIVVAGRRISH